MEVVVRDARPDDAPDVASLLGELGYPATRTEGHEYVRHFQAMPYSRLQLAEVDQKAVGLVATHVVPRLNADRRSCHITEIVVLQSHRRLGIASRVLAAAEEEARRHGAPRLDLSSADDRQDAHGFYRRCGFTTPARTFTKRL